MSDLTEQDYEGFRRVTDELINTFNARQRFHETEDYVPPEPIRSIRDIVVDADLYRDEYLPRLRNEQDAAVGAAALKGYYLALVGDGVPDFETVDSEVKAAWIAAGKAAAEAVNG